VVSIMSDRSRERDRPDLGVASEGESAALCTRGADSVLFGRYELGTCQRSSGAAAVCQAFDRDRGREVVVHHAPVSASAPGSHEALLARLRPLIEFRHPNVVPLLDAGIEHDELYLVSERPDGDLLSELLPASGPLDPETASGLAAQICDALSAAHQRGLRHGGLCPEQILITDSGDPLLLRFGWSDVTDAAVDWTAARDFTAPEQRADRRAGDQRSDLWSLGAVLCRATTGAAPPVAHPEHIPEPLRTPVLKALANDPERRMRSAAEFRTAVETCVAPQSAAMVETTAAAQTATAAAAPRSNLFFPLVILAGALFVVTILAMLAVPFGDPEAPIAGWIERYAGRLIAAEVVLVLVLGFLALLVDRRRTMRAAVGQSRPAAARPE
jgi:hypothetical protein